jgi:hypothetical protein
MPSDGELSDGKPGTCRSAAASSARHLPPRCRHDDSEPCRPRGLPPAARLCPLLNKYKSDGWLGPTPLLLRLPATTTTTTTILQHLRLCRTRAWARTDSAPTDCVPFTNLWPAAAGPLHMGQDSRYDHYRYQLAAWHLLIRCSSARARTDWEPTGASTFAEANSVGTQRRPRRYRSFTSIPTPAAPLYPLLKCLGP